MHSLPVCDKVNTDSVNGGIFLDPSIFENVISELGSGFLSGFIIWLPIWGIYMLIFALRAVGLYTIAKRRGVKSPWMAWVPVADQYLLGNISDQYWYVTKGQIKKKRRLLPVLNIGKCVLCILSGVLALISMVGVFVGAASNAGALEAFLTFILPGIASVLLGLSAMVAAIAWAIFRSWVLYDLYLSCDPNNAVLYLVLSIIGGLMGSFFFILNLVEPILILINQKKDGGMVVGSPAAAGSSAQQPAGHIYQPEIPACQSAEPVPEASCGFTEEPAAKPVDPWGQI